MNKYIGTLLLLSSTTFVVADEVEDVGCQGYGYIVAVGTQDKKTAGTIWISQTNTWDDVIVFQVPKNKAYMLGLAMQAHTALTIVDIKGKKPCVERSGGTIREMLLY